MKRNRGATSDPDRSPRGSIATVRAEFRGPLPPPEMLQRYDTVIPGGAERILAMAELQAAHRRDLEHRMLRGNLRAQMLGQVFAFVVVLAGMGLGGLLILSDHRAEGLASILLPLATVAGVFLVARRSRERERLRKWQKTGALGMHPEDPEDRRKATAGEDDPGPHE